MKIALIILHADPQRGGAERYTVDLAGGLARRGHEVSLLAASFNGELDERVQRETMAAKGRTRVGRYQRFLASVDSQLDAGAYDIAHAMLPVRRCDIYHPHAGLALAQARRTGLRMIFAPRRWAMARIERQLLEAAHPPIVLSLSEYVKAEITRHYPKLPPERLRTLFNAVDLERFKPMPRSGAIREKLERDGVVALFVGRDVVRKGLGQAIAAVLMLAEKGPTLAVLGTEAGVDLSKASLAESGEPMEGRVISLGSASDPRPFYADADFLVLPTRHDPCSLVVLEALAMGLPVISTRFNGATEIMTDGIEGYVLPDPSDVEALAGAMGKMMDPDRREQMRDGAIALRPRLSYEQHVDALESVYANALSGRALKSA